MSFFSFKIIFFLVHSIQSKMSHNLTPQTVDRRTYNSTLASRMAYHAQTNSAARNLNATLSNAAENNPNRTNPTPMTPVNTNLFF